MILVFNF